MKRIAILLCLLMTLSQLQAQSPTPEPVIISRSEHSKTNHFGISASADLNFLRGGINGISNEHFPTRPGFTANGWYNLALHSKVSLRFGVGYGFRQHQIQNDSIILSSDIDPQLGVVSSSRLNYTLTHHDLQVPVMAFFHPKGTESGFYVGAGALTGLVLTMRSTGELVSANGTVEQLDYTERPGALLLAAQACAGSRFPLANGSALGVELVGNAHLFELENYPARPFGTSLRLCYWL